MPQRFDPYKNFKFRVKWDGKLRRRRQQGRRAQAHAPRSSSTARAATRRTCRKSPGRTKYEAITLERGVTHDTEFEKWANKVWNFGSGLGAEVSLKDFRKDLIIEVYNEAGQVVHRLQGLPLLGLASTRRCPTSTRTPTRSRSRRSSSRTRAGNATTRWPSRPSRASSSRSPTTMALLVDADVLAAWEASLARPAPLRAAVLIALAEPGLDEPSVAALPLGEVARRLLLLHERWFGGGLHCTGACPACGAVAEADCDVGMLASAAPERATAPAVLTLALGDWRLRFRLPTLLDLAHAARAGDAAAARALPARALRARGRAWRPGLWRARPAARGLARGRRGDGGGRSPGRHRARPALPGLRSCVDGDPGPRALRAGRCRRGRAGTAVAGAPTGPGLRMDRGRDPGARPRAPPRVPRAGGRMGAPGRPQRSSRRAQSGRVVR
ncbi:MAG: phage tail protein [Desulfobacterales bacterium]|nr:phage tail protein [Desulfobacterales bacterium]